MLALLAPGQGSQSPGMLTPWLDLPQAEARIRWLSAVAGLDLMRLGTTADEDEVRDTSVAQPLIVALGLLALAELPVDDIDIVAGHSVGELTAAAAADALSVEGTMAFAALRGREMSAACSDTPTGMSAVLGGDTDDVLTRLEACGLAPANWNSTSQVVAAGPVAGLAQLSEQPPSGARVVPLSVAGAFHTDYMASAEQALQLVAEGITVQDPKHILLSNLDGRAVTAGTDLIQRLVRQVVAPVRWDLCQASLRDLGVTALIELPPAGTLSGLAKRELPDVKVMPLRSPDDLTEARDFISRTTRSHQDQHTPDWRVVVAPVKGVFYPAEVSEGSVVIAGTPLGEVHTKRDQHVVNANCDGQLVEWLLAHGDLVDAGEPLARLHPGTGGAM